MGSVPLMISTRVVLNWQIEKRIKTLLLSGEVRGACFHSDGVNARGMNNGHRTREQRVLEASFLMPFDLRIGAGAHEMPSRDSDVA